MKKLCLFLLMCLIVTINNSTAQIPYPGDNPGQAIVNTLHANQLILENNVVKIKFANNRGKITIESFENKKPLEQIKIGNAALFELALPDSRVISSNDFTLVNSPFASNIVADPQAITYANRLSGKKYSADLKNKKLGLNVHWEAQLRDGSNYVRQIFTITSKDTVKISKIILIKIPLNNDVRKEGIVDGVPIVHRNMFFSIENPLNKIEQSNIDLIAILTRSMPITSSDPFTVSSVWGTTPINQLRRGYLYYIERERAAPYHQMSFYNSWGDIAWDDRKMSERACLERIRWIGDSLINKRHVKLKAFLFDDGWDDDKTLWKFHSGFPNGFTELKEVAESYGSTIGVWISPFGGFSVAKKQRLEYGKKQNPPFETNDRGFSLAGPVYYNRYKEVLINFVKEYNISMLKFDGLAAGSSGADAYQKDVESYLKVTKEVRDVKPDLYFCLTTGTWPSPYFLKYGDCVWRGGGDYGYAGEGSNRQRWITYRDADVYKNVVKRSPLYPLNALQQMGIFICDLNVFGEFGMDEKDISDDIWSAIATGTAVQGLYINAYRMNTAAWDCLADAITWAKENESIMADTHWIGGDPAKGEIYGFAAWSPQKAVLTLRNPSKEEKMFEVNIAKVFELPLDAKNEFLFYDAKMSTTTGNKQPLAQGRSFRITLKPLEVKVFNALLKE